MSKLKTKNKKAKANYDLDLVPEKVPSSPMKKKDVDIKYNKPATSHSHIKSGNNSHLQVKLETLDEQIDIFKKECPIWCEEISHQVENRVWPHCLNIYCSECLRDVIQKLGKWPMCTQNIDKNHKLAADKTYKTMITNLNEKKELILKKLEATEVTEESFWDIHKFPSDLFCPECQKLHCLECFKEGIHQKVEYKSLYESFLEKIEEAEEKNEKLEEFLHQLDLEKEWFEEVSEFNTKDLKAYADLLISGFKKCLYQKIKDIKGNVDQIDHHREEVHQWTNELRAYSSKLKVFLAQKDGKLLIKRI